MTNNFGTIKKLVGNRFCNFFHLPFFPHFLGGKGNGERITSLSIICNPKKFQRLCIFSLEVLLPHKLFLDEYLFPQWETQEDLEVYLFPQWETQEDQWRHIEYGMYRDMFRDLLKKSVTLSYVLMDNFYPGFLSRLMKIKFPLSIWQKGGK